MARKLSELEAMTIGGWHRENESRDLTDAVDRATGVELDEIPAESVELDARASGGVLVELRLSTAPVAGVVFLRVTEAEGEPRTVGIPPSLARDAFDHPYAYLPRA